MATQVWRDRPKAKRTEHWKLVTPAHAKLGPAVDEDDRRPFARAACQIERVIAFAAKRVFSDLEERHPEIHSYRLVWSSEPRSGPAVGSVFASVITSPP
jgi:hypothetical protein